MGDRFARVPILVAILLTPLGVRAGAADDETTRRIRFIEQRLDAGRASHTAWHVGWVSVYGVGLLVQVGRATMAIDPAERADQIVGASKAVVGVVAHLVRPPVAMFGARELALMPEATPEEREAKLRRAELLLVRAAHESDRRWSPWAHAANVGLNVVGLLVVGLGWGDWERAALSSSIGVIVGEASILSQPWRARRDLRDYREASFGTELGALPRTRSRIEVQAAGAAVRVTW